MEGTIVYSEGHVLPETSRSRIKYKTNDKFSRKQRIWLELGSTHYLALFQYIEIDGQRSAMHPPYSARESAEELPAPPNRMKNS